MKRFVYILLSLILGVTVAFSQDKAVISSEKTTHDFGKIKEADGPVSYVFKIDNKGDGPLILTRVIASCGCTTPEWTKEPIAAGKNGEIKITYNPKDRPGPFVKTISVYSNGKTGSYILTIKGEVEE
jgi:phosphopantothenoylcysteine synthetase/decarboxylase